VRIQKFGASHRKAKSFISLCLAVSRLHVITQRIREHMVIKTSEIQMNVTSYIQVPFLYFGLMVLHFVTR
jgi:hypothetical protein